jgi:hypothetical protein
MAGKKSPKSSMGAASALNIEAIRTVKVAKGAHLAIKSHHSEVPIVV